MSDKSRTGVTARLFGERAMRRGSKVSSISLKALDLERPIREARVLRGLWGAAQGIRQLAREVQSRAAAIGPQTARPAPQPSHTLGHSLSHRLSHMTYGSPVSGPIVPPAREGHRRRFNEADKHQILEEAVQAGANLSETEGFGSKLVHRSMLTSPPSSTSLMSRSSEDFLTAP